MGSCFAVCAIGKSLSKTDEMGQMVQHDGTLSEETEALNMLRRNKINGVFFNLVTSSSEDTCVVVTPDRVYAATKYLFNPNENPAGLDFVEP